MGQCVSQITPEQISELQRIAKPENLRRLADTLEGKTTIKDIPTISIEVKPKIETKEIPFEKPPTNNTVIVKKISNNQYDFITNNYHFKSKPNTFVYVFNYKKSFDEFIEEFNDEIRLNEIKKDYLHTCTFIARHPSGNLMCFEFTNFTKYVELLVNKKPTIVNYEKKDDKGNYTLNFMINNLRYFCKSDERFLSSQIKIDPSDHSVEFYDKSGEYCIGKFKDSVLSIFSHEFSIQNYFDCSGTNDGLYFSLENWTNPKQENKNLFKVKKIFPEDCYITFSTNIGLFKKCSILKIDNSIKSPVEHPEDEPQALPIIVPPPTAPPVETPSLPSISALPPIPIHISDLPPIPERTSEPTSEPIPA